VRHGAAALLAVDSSAPAMAGASGVAHDDEGEDVVLALVTVK
jgi:hypothetical protein